MSVLAASIVDGGAVAKSLAAALIVGAGLTSLYGLAIRSAERLTTSRREGSGIAVLDVLLIAVVALLCLGALAVGVVAMTHKS